MNRYIAEITGSSITENWGNYSDALLFNITEAFADLITMSLGEYEARISYKLCSGRLTCYCDLDTRVEDFYIRKIRRIFKLASTSEKKVKLICREVKS